MQKTKSQKLLGANSYVCRSYRGKTDREAFLLLPPPRQSRIGLRLRWPANARNKDGKLHTHTVPVKLCCPQNNKRKPHIGAYFAMASVKYARDLAELFSDEPVFFLFQDGKC